MVRHGGDWVYGYAKPLLVPRGQTSRQGEMIALSGATGAADAPQLHFELRRGRASDPVKVLPPRS